MEAINLTDEEARNYISLIFDGYLKRKEEYYHGECVAMGIKYFLSFDLYERVFNLLKKYHLPYMDDIEVDEMIYYFEHDKKNDENGINVVFVNEIGKSEIKNISFEQLLSRIGDVKNYVK